MKTSQYLSIVFFIVFAYSCSVNKNGKSAEIPKIEGYHLLWSDEFDQDGKPNQKNWSFEQGFVRNNELQWYQEKNANVKDGLLIIEGKREHIKNTNYNAKSTDWRKNREYAAYSSASINTRNQFSFQYGILEVKAKIDTLSGLWPAIWTLGITKPWPSNGEIDLMEYYQIDNKPHILANAAWQGVQKVLWDSEHISFNSFVKKDTNWSTKFHIWKMDWTKDFIKLYLDNELLNKVDLSKTQNPDGFNPFHQPHYVLLNLAIGSNGGDPSETNFPKQYIIDYVRVYQKDEQH